MELAVVSLDVSDVSRVEDSETVVTEEFPTFVVCFPLGNLLKLKGVRVNGSNGACSEVPVLLG